MISLLIIQLSLQISDWTSYKQKNVIEKCEFENLMLSAHAVIKSYAVSILLEQNSIVAIPSEAIAPVSRRSSGVSGRTLSGIRTSKDDNTACSVKQ